MFPILYTEADELSDFITEPAFTNLIPPAYEIVLTKTALAL